MAIDESEKIMELTYKDEDTLWDKLNTVARNIYGASGVSMDAKVSAHLDYLQEHYGNYPICVAKTQSSFSDDPANKEAATKWHTLTVRELRLCSGAEFIVAVCGNIMTLPGLPERPNAERIDINSKGNIVGLD
jgi:formate--tetrahydrofolate ligase